MKITALLAAHNRRQKSLACLSSYFTQEVPDGVTLSAVLVDDGSTDGTADAVRERFPEVGDLRERRPVLGRRDGARRAGGSPAGSDFLLWLNDDATLDAGALTTLIETAESGGRWLHRRGGPAGSLERRAELLGRPPESESTRCASPWSPAEDRPIQVDTLNGNVVLVSRAARAGRADRRRVRPCDSGLRLRAARRERRRPVLLAPGTIGSCPINPNPAPGRIRRSRSRAVRALVSPKGLPPRTSPAFCGATVGPPGRSSGSRPTFGRCPRSCGHATSRPHARTPTRTPFA